MSTEKQITDAVLNYISNQILLQSSFPDKWVIWNGAIIKIVDTLWIKDDNKFYLKYPDFKCQGTILEALHAIENNNLLKFLTTNS